MGGTEAHIWRKNFVTGIQLKSYLEGVLVRVLQRKRTNRKCD
jgi:hypothetical protein